MAFPGEANPTPGQKAQWGALLRSPEAVALLRYLRAARPPVGDANAERMGGREDVSDMLEELAFPTEEPAQENAYGADVTAGLN